MQHTKQPVGTHLWEKSPRHPKLWTVAVSAIAPRHHKMSLSACSNQGEVAGLRQNWPVRCLGGKIPLLQHQLIQSPLPVPKDSFLVPNPFRPHRPLLQACPHPQHCVRVGSDEHPFQKTSIFFSFLPRYFQLLKQIGLVLLPSWALKLQIPPYPQ